jgi:hypothetical protein
MTRAWREIDERAVATGDRIGVDNAYSSVYDEVISDPMFRCLMLASPDDGVSGESPKRLGGSYQAPWHFDRSCPLLAAVE